MIYTMPSGRSTADAKRRDPDLGPEAEVTLLYLDRDRGRVTVTVRFFNRYVLPHTTHESNSGKRK